MGALNREVVFGELQVVEPSAGHGSTNAVPSEIERIEGSVSVGVPVAAGSAMDGVRDGRRMSAVAANQALNVGTLHGLRAAFGACVYLRLRLGTRGQGRVWWVGLLCRTIPLWYIC